MRKAWVHRAIDAPAGAVWELLTDPQRWPEWGPTVRKASLDGPLDVGATGTVTTLLGIDLRFEITAFDAGSRWAWKVAGVQATDHTVEALTPDRCRAGFGVPWPAAPYLAVCQVALRRLEVMASTTGR